MPVFINRYLHVMFRERTQEEENIIEKKEEANFMTTKNSGI